MVTKKTARRAMMAYVILSEHFEGYCIKNEGPDPNDMKKAINRANAVYYKTLRTLPPEEYPAFYESLTEGMVENTFYLVDRLRKTGVLK